MELQTILHIAKDLEHDREVIERLVNINLEGKLSNYMKKFEGNPDAEGVLEFFVEANAHRMFNAKLLINIDGKSYRYEREDYHKLDDLINHLFKHFKEELSKH